MNLKQSFVKSAKSLWIMLPIILGTVLLVSLITTLIPNSFYTYIFSKSKILDSIVGALAGSISAGNPVISYILGGELLKEGIGLIAVTAFLVSWVTVGIIQLPAESILLGKKFAIIRNVTAFILAIVVAIMTVVIVGVI